MGDSMIRRLFIIVTLGITLSGCFMAPLAFIGPAVSGFSTASIIQSGLTTVANNAIQKSTGKTISEHVFDTISKEIMQNAYLPMNNKNDSLKVTP